MDTDWCSWITGCDLLCQRSIGTVVTNWNDPCRGRVSCVHHYRGQHRAPLLSLPCLRQRTNCTLWTYIRLEQMPDMWGSPQVSGMLFNYSLRPKPLRGACAIVWRTAVPRRSPA